MTKQVVVGWGVPACRCCASPVASVGGNRGSIHGSEVMAGHGETSLECVDRCLRGPGPREIPVSEANYRSPGAQRGRMLVEDSRMILQIAQTGQEGRRRSSRTSPDVVPLD